MKPISKNAYSGDYPLARFLYLYVNKAPNKELDPMRREFLKYVLSHQGQEAVVKAGYYPLTKQLAEQELHKLGIE